MSNDTKGPITVIDGGQDISLYLPSGINICIGDAIYNRERSLGIAFLLSSSPDLYRALTELYALVSGECPSLLESDSGGDYELDADIKKALSKAKGVLE